jgi:hypothetical protein
MEPDKPPIEGTGNLQAEDALWWTLPYEMFLSSKEGKPEKMMEMTVTRKK